MTPLPWVVRWAGQIPATGPVLDLACGNGRHAAYLAGLGYPVEAVDVDLAASEPLRATVGVRWLRHDLEGAAWPFAAGAFAGVVVTNYLHRPLFPHLLTALMRGGTLIYSTFSVGQGQFGRPRNPHHLLLPGELLEVVRGRMRVVAYEDVIEEGGAPARVQRLCAVKP